MTIVVVKRNEPRKYITQFLCTHCKSTLQAEREDWVTVHSAHTSSTYKQLTCPVCFKAIRYMNVTHIPVLKPETTETEEQQS